MHVLLDRVSGHGGRSGQQAEAFLLPLDWGCAVLGRLADSEGGSRVARRGNLVVLEGDCIGLWTANDGLGCIDEIQMPLQRRKLSPDGLFGGCKDVCKKI